MLKINKLINKRLRLSFMIHTTNFYQTRFTYSQEFSKSVFTFAFNKLNGSHFFEDIVQ